MKNISVTRVGTQTLTIKYYVNKSFIRHRADLRYHVAQGEYITHLTL